MFDPKKGKTPTYDSRRQINIFVNRAPKKTAKKRALKPLVSRAVVKFYFSFCQFARIFTNHI